MARPTLTPLQAELAALHAYDVEHAPDDATANQIIASATRRGTNAERCYVLHSGDDGLFVVAVAGAGGTDAERELVLSHAQAALALHRTKHTDAAASGKRVPDTDDSLPVAIDAKALGDREIVRGVVVIVRRLFARGAPGPAGDFVGEDRAFFRVICSQSSLGLSLRPRLPGRGGSRRFSEPPATKEKGTRKLDPTEEEKLRLAYPEILGRSARHLELLKTIDRLARKVTTTCLILGETGTGKELVAAAIHRVSRLAGKLLSVNCAALPEQLLASELFGHRKGSYTGAVADRKGKAEEAEGGTLFLDEIGDMPLAQQPALLRFLQEKEVTPLGANGPVKVNVRIVAATNASLERLVAEGKFRADLYYRLKVGRIELPPLRERREDVRLLATYFLAKHAGDSELGGPSVPRSTREPAKGGGRES